MSRFSLVAETQATMPVVVPLEGMTLQAVSTEITNEDFGWMIPQFIIDFEEKKTYRVGYLTEEGRQFFDNAAEFFGPATETQPWIAISLNEEQA